MASSMNKESPSTEIQRDMGKSCRHSFVLSVYGFKK